MGGYGSGWHRHDKKRRVEDALVLQASGYKPFVAQAHGSGSRLSGTSTWGREGDRNRDRIGWTYLPGTDAPEAVAEAGGGTAGRLRLAYDRLRGDEREPVEYALDVEVRPCHFGGWRVYLRCPLVKGGRPCGARCEKAYLPPGSRHFGCRGCHDLTYRSAQEAHHFDGLFKRLGAQMGMDWRDVERALEARI